MDVIGHMQGMTSRTWTKYSHNWNQLIVKGCAIEMAMNTTGASRTCRSSGDIRGHSREWCNRPARPRSTSCYIRSHRPLLLRSMTVPLRPVRCSLRAHRAAASTWRSPESCEGGWSAKRGDGLRWEVQVENSPDDDPNPYFCPLHHP